MFLTDSACRKNLGRHHAGGSHKPLSDGAFAEFPKARGEGFGLHLLRLLEEEIAVGFKLAEEKERIDDDKNECGASRLLD